MVRLMLIFGVIYIILWYVNFMILVFSLIFWCVRNSAITITWCSTAEIMKEVLRSNRVIKFWPFDKRCGLLCPTRFPSFQILWFFHSSFSYAYPSGKLVRTLMWLSRFYITFACFCTLEKVCLALSVHDNLELGS